MESKKDLNRIKVMLAEKKKTNKWLASALGVNAATVSKWCTNSSQPSLETLMKIAELLEVNYTELIRVEPNFECKEYLHHPHRTDGWNSIRS